MSKKTFIDSVAAAHIALHGKGGQHGESSTARAARRGHHGEGSTAQRGQHVAHLLFASSACIGAPAAASLLPIKVLRLMNLASDCHDCTFLLPIEVLRLMNLASDCTFRLTVPFG